MKILDSSFSGAQGTLVVGDTRGFTLQVNVTAWDLDSNESSKTVWFDFEAPTILPGEFGDQNGDNNDDGISCSPPNDHHLNKRTCTVKVTDHKSLGRIEVHQGGFADPIMTIYRDPAAPIPGDAPPFGDEDGNCIPPGCDSQGWPTPLTYTYEFELNMTGQSFPGKWNHYYVRVFDESGNQAISNGHFALAADIWNPTEVDRFVSGDNGVIELRAAFYDGTGDVDVEFSVGGQLVCQKSGKGWSTNQFIVSCLFDSQSVANGPRTWFINVVDQWGNASNRGQTIEINNEPEEPDPEPCPAVFNELEPNSNPPNYIRTCTRRIFGDFDRQLPFNLDGDQYLFTLQPGERMTVTSSAFCSHAFLNICPNSSVCSFLDQSMGSASSRTVRNSADDGKAFNIQVKMYDNCQFRQYDLHLTLTTF